MRYMAVLMLIFLSDGFSFVSSLFPPCHLSLLLQVWINFCWHLGFEVWRKESGVQKSVRGDRRDIVFLPVSSVTFVEILFDIACVHWEMCQSTELTRSLSQTFWHEGPDQLPSWLTMLMLSRGMKIIRMDFFFILRTRMSSQGSMDLSFQYLVYIHLSWKGNCSSVFHISKQSFATSTW